MYSVGRNVRELGDPVSDVVAVGVVVAALLGDVEKVEAS